MYSQEFSKNTNFDVPDQTTIFRLQNFNNNHRKKAPPPNT